MSNVEANLLQAESLSTIERHELRLRLLEGDLSHADSSVEAAWGNEIAQRLAEYDRGEVDAVDGARVIEEAPHTVRRRVTQSAFESTLGRPRARRDRCGPSRPQEGV